MKIALPVWDEWVSPVFDVCREALILEIDNGEVISTGKIDINTATPLLRIESLAGLGVEILICGAISEEAQVEAESRGLKVIGFVTGEIEEVVPAFISGGLPSPEFSMPGHCGKRRRLRGARVQRRGRGRG